MQIKTINLGRGAFGQPGVPFLLSRRAHLLTTPKGRWYFLRQPCALRGGCGFCGSLMDNATSRRSLSTQTAQCSASYAQQGDGDLPPPFRRLPAKICHRQFFAVMGIALATPFSFCEKETKTENERTVRTDGDLSLGSEGGQQRFGALCSCRFRLSELF